MSTSESDTERFSVNQRLKGVLCKSFKQRVDPVMLNDALSHKVRLTDKQEDEMRAKMDTFGRWNACDFLFTQLVKKTDWFKYLLRALADPHVGLEDFAEFCKQKEAEIMRHSGETTTDDEEGGYLKLLDEPDGIGRQSHGGYTMPRPTEQYSPPDEDVYEDVGNDNRSVYDDAMSLPYPVVIGRRSGRPRGNGHRSAQPRTIQHDKAAVSPLQNENYYSTAYSISPASSQARHKESLGAKRAPLEQYDDDGYTQIFSRGSTSLVRPEISSREGVPHRSSQYHRDTAADTHTHVARYKNVAEVGQPLRGAVTSSVRPASSASHGKSDDDERTRLSTIYSLGTGARSAFRLFPPVVSVPQLSPDYYNPYVRKVAEDDQRPVSRDANARDINQLSGNSDNFSLRTTTSSRKDILCSRENSCRVDDRTRREDVSSGTHSAKGPRRQARDDVLTSPHTGEGEQLMSQCSVPSSQSKTYSDLDRGEFFGTPSDSTQREGEGHIVPAEAEYNMPTTRGAQGVATGGDFTRAEVDTELTNFPGYTPNITDDEVRNRMQRCKDNTYILWYSESEQRPALGVVYNSTFMTFTIKKRSSYSGTKFFVDRDQKDGYSLTELLQYHLGAGIKDTRPSSYRQKIMLKYPFLE